MTAQATTPSAKAKPKRLSPTKQRKLVETAIERLVELLDEIDPDAEAEPECEDEGAQCEDEGAQHESEPTLGWRNEGSQSGLQASLFDGESEPELGWTSKEASTGKYDLWKQAEDEHDGSEPSLGWGNEGSQERLHSSPGDREWDCEDEGAEHDNAEPWGVGIHGGGSGGAGI